MVKRLVSAPRDYEPWPVEYLIDEEEEEGQSEEQKRKDTTEAERDSASRDERRPICLPFIEARS